jgi:rSAM/selenodomain-associated transferase 1
VPGRVKTRLAATLGAERAAELQGAFLADLCERLASSPGHALWLAWALAEGEDVPGGGGVEIPAVRQQGDDLGARLFHALAAAAEGHGLVAAVGSDHPQLTTERVDEAFAALEAGADVAIGPATDGGYYLIAVRRAALDRRLFDGVSWSTSRVLAETLERCRQRSLAVTLLAAESDVDTGEDLSRLVRALREPGAVASPRTADLLRRWGMLEPALPEAVAR